MNVLIQSSPSTMCVDCDGAKARHSALEWATRKAAVCPEKHEFAAIAKLLAD